LVHRVAPDAQLLNCSYSQKRGITNTMGFFEKLLDDVSLARKASDVKGTAKKTFNLQLSAKNKRMSVTLKDVQILQLVPFWFDIVKKPKNVRVEGKTHKLIVWHIKELKPREQKTITLQLRSDAKKEGEIGTAHSSYIKVFGKNKKHVYDGYIGGPIKIY